MAKPQITRDKIYEIIMGQLLIPPQHFSPNGDLVHSYDLDSLGSTELHLSLDEYFKVNTKMRKWEKQPFRTPKDIADFYLEYHNVAE